MRRGGLYFVNSRISTTGEGWCRDRKKKVAWFQARWAAQGHPGSGLPLVLRKALLVAPHESLRRGQGADWCLPSQPQPTLGPCHSPSCPHRKMKEKCAPSPGLELETNRGWAHILSPLPFTYPTLQPKSHKKICLDGDIFSSSPLNP